ncbi:alpha/beta hydrolase [Rheinheimera riviphila]|uniref:Alpha/beta hydrolase n=2 Tax=Rheinheimera riviphila TaxID=1834037 RepID=A0A437QMF8_9GAMM|nr:alpha/beta hydrolase [Rheinheimera riviphila]
MASDYLQQLAQQLAAQGIEVWRFNFGYMAKTVAGKKQPPSKVATLLQEMLAVINAMPNDLPIFMGGKSMGGRVATLLAADKTAFPVQVQGVLAFGYPFCPPAKKALGIAPRTGHFSALQRPLLIVQGERDAFGGPEDLNSSGWPLVEISWLDGGDHDLKTLKRHRQTQAQLLAQASLVAGTFVRRLLAVTK